MKKKKLRSFVAGAILATPFVMSHHSYASTGFTDINNSYAKDAIIQLQDAGIISGYGDSTYNPSGTLTRAQYVKILVLSNKLDISNPPKTPTFKDIPKTAWEYPYVEAAVKAGYIKGYADGTFKGEAPLSRQHMATLFVRSLDIDVTGEGASLKFTDKIPVEYQDAIGYAVKQGLMSGKADGTFNPTGNATREQVAKVAVTFLKVKDEVQKPKPEPKPEPKPDSGSGSGLTSQQIAINKIDKIVKDADASKITLNDINIAIKGKSVTTVEGNLDVYRDVISSAEDTELNSAEKIANMVADVNTTLDKEITEGISVTGGTDFRYRLLTDPSKFNLLGASKVVSWATPMDDTFKSSDIYATLKGVPSYDSSYFFTIPTIVPLKLKPESVGVYQVLFAYVGDNKQVLGYSLHNNIEVSDNNFPVVSELWAAPEFTIGQEGTLDLTGLFTDEDGDVLTYSIEALDKEIATVTEGEENAQPTIHPLAIGTARFKVTVDDGRGGISDKTVSVTINPANGTGGDTDNGNSTPQEVPTNTAINLTATPSSPGSGNIDLWWNGFSDPNWDHHELYYLVSETGDANESSTLHYAGIKYPGRDGVQKHFESGKRVSFAMYSVMKDGSKTVQKVSVVAP